MREMGLVLWFLVVTVAVTIFVQYKEAVLAWWNRIKTSQEEKQKTVWQHPVVHWGIKGFLALSAVAWLNFIAWGITSVLPLALVLLIIGGRRSLKDSGHLLIILSAFWTISRLLFDASPTEFFDHFNLSTLSQLYNVPIGVMRPLVVPTVIIFFLGISSLIWKKNVHWGVIAILAATCFPFILGFFYSGTAKEVIDWKMQFASQFYGVPGATLRVLLLPQIMAILCGVYLIAQQRSFVGGIWIGVGLLSPLAVAPLQKLYLSYAGNGDKQGFEALAHFYGMNPEIFKLIIVFQVTLIFTSIVLAFRKSTFSAVCLFFCGMLLPWFVLWAGNLWRQVLIHQVPANLQELASLYGIPEEKIKSYVFPMLIISIVGLILLFRKDGPGWGLVFVALGVCFPWAAQLLVAGYESMQVALNDGTLKQGTAEYYQISPERMKILLLPMILLFIFGVIAMFKQRGFWGGVLISIAVFIPWLTAPAMQFFEIAKQHNWFQSYVMAFYGSSENLGIYVPAMVLCFILGCLQMTVKNRLTFGSLLLILAIYVPFWVPEFTKAFLR